MKWVEVEKPTEGQKWVEVPGKSGMSHPPQSKELRRIQAISEELGYDNVDWSTELGGFDRIDLGLSSQENQLQKIRDKHPDYNVRNFDGRIMVQPPGKAWHPVDAPKFTANDISDFSGEVLPLVGSLGLLALGPASPGGAALASGLGTVAGRLINTGIESWRGYEPPEGHVADAVGEGSLDAAVGMGGMFGGKLANTLTGRGAFGPHKDLTKEYKELYDYLSKNKEIAYPLATQMTQEGNSINRILQQANSMSVEAKNRIVDQQLSSSRQLKNMQPGASDTRVGTDLRTEALAAQERLKPRIGAVSHEKHGIETKSAMDKWIAAKDNQINAEYAKVRSAAKIEQPLFDLTPVKQKFESLGVYGIGKPQEAGIGVIDVNGSEFTRQIWPLVNAADTPGAKLKRVGEILSRLDDTQTNWEVIKELRSSVGKIVKNAPWESNVDIGSAKQMHRALTEALENPSHLMVNGVYRKGATGLYNGAINIAGRTSRSKFEVLEKSRIRNIIQTDDPRGLGEMFSKIGGMTPEVRDVLDVFPDHKAITRGRAFQDIANSKNGAFNAVEEWYERDTDTAKWLFGVDRTEVNAAAEAIDKYNSTTLAQIQRNEKPLSVARTLIESPDMSPVEMRELIGQFGGRGSKGHQLMRAAMMSDIIDKSLLVGEKTGWAIDKKAMQNAIKSYKKNGAWEQILSKSDRAELANLERYARLILGNSTDLGVSLVAANVASGFKHPSKFVSSARELTLNKVLADIAMNPTIVKGVSGVGKAPLNNKVFAGVPIFLNHLGESIYADPQVEEMMGK